MLDEKLRRKLFSTPWRAVLVLFSVSVAGCPIIKPGGPYPGPDSRADGGANGIEPSGGSPGLDQTDTASDRRNGGSSGGFGGTQN